MDGLTNAQEIELNTDPVNPDTDGDGYIDGIEVTYRYNPNGSGKIEAGPTVDFAYGQTRLSNLNQEAEMSLQLKLELEGLFGGPIPVAANNWPTLVNSYIYGNYPVMAVYQSIIWGGKTVHPNIPWSAWQNTADYIEYINK